MKDLKVLENVVEMPVGNLFLNPNNVRNKETDYDLNDPKMEELVADIKIKGILQPLVVLEDGMILFGNRRYVAAKHLGLKTVPCITRKVESEAEIIFFQMSENMVRKFPASLERGKAYVELMNKYKFSEKDLSKRTGDTDVYACVAEYKNYLESEKEVGKKRVEEALGKLRLTNHYSRTSKIIFKRMQISPKDKVQLTEVICEKETSATAAEAVAQQLQNDKNKNHSKKEIEAMVDKASLVEEHTILIRKEDWEFYQAVWESTKKEPTLRHYMIGIVERARKSGIK